MLYHTLKVTLTWRSITGTMEEIVKSNSHPHVHFQHHVLYFLLSEIDILWLYSKKNKSQT